MDKRNNMCGIGTRKLKLFLNKKLKEGDLNAQIFRIALEIEDYNIQAKKAYGEYKDKIYYSKECAILALIEIFRDNGLCYGYQKSDSYSTKNVIFFELPNTEQISFHINADLPNYVPLYDKEWDGKINSTLDKIEDGLLKTYEKIE